MRRLFSVVLVGCALCATGVGAVKVKLEPPTVKSTVEGAYEIRKAGEQVGTEEFVRITLSNNTVIIKTTYDVAETDDAVVSGKNQLEFEEDSGFPKHYTTQRFTRGADGEHTREVIVDLFANVAVLTERYDEIENRRILELPTGCLFIEGNIASQLSFVLNRYNPTAGGRQGFRAFDPLGGSTTDVAVEFVGDSTLTAAEWGEGAVPPTLSALHYKFYAGRLPAIDLYVINGGIVARVDVGFRDMSYVLTSLTQGGRDEAPSQ